MRSRSVPQRLRDAVDEARAQLEAYATRLTLEPDARHEEAFQRYARALRALVADHLYADGWSVAGDPQDTARVWRWDGYARAFHFDYTGRSELATTTEPEAHEGPSRGHLSRRRLLWHRAAMELDPAKDLDAELRRLADEARTYRQAAELMEVAWSRRCAHAEETARLEDEIPHLLPGSVLVQAHGGHLFAIQGTDQVGRDTGRRRYRVECRSCGRLIHAASTSAKAQVEYHLRHPEEGEPLIVSEPPGDLT